MSGLNHDDLPIEGAGIPRSNLAATDGNIPQIVVPADLVARSRPSRHSVPITHAKHKVARSHPYRNMIVPCLIALVALLGLIIAVDYSVEMGRAAGYRLDCSVVDSGRAAVKICRWEKI